MADGTTPKLALVKPEVDASEDTWGDKLNANWDIVDNLLQDAPSDGKQYARINAAWSKVVTTNYGTAWSYSFGVTAAAPPAVGTVRLNNTTQSAATVMWIHYTNGDGIDTKTYFAQRVRVGDTFYIQDRDEAARWQLYEVNAAFTDNGTYASVPVTWKAGGTALIAQQIVVSRESAGATPAVGEAPNDGKLYGRENQTWAQTAKVTVGTSAPSSPDVGDIWIDTT